MVNTIAKRIQTRLSKLGVKVSLGDIRPVVEQMVSDFDNPSAEQVNKVIDHFMDTATSLTVIDNGIDNLDNGLDNLDIENAIAPTTDPDQDYPEQSKSGELAHTPKGDLITTTADQMGIVLDASEISQIAENINDSSDDFEQDIDAIKSAIMAFVEHKARINQSKINNLIVEVREVVGRENQRNSRILSDGLSQINSDIQQANKDFKSNVSKALSAFATIKAG